MIFIGAFSYLSLSYATKKKHRLIDDQIKEEETKTIKL